MLKIKHPGTNEILEVNAFWLRDHCRCARCFHPRTKQRVHCMLDIPDDIHPVSTELNNDKTEYEVEWSDGHKSIYEFDFLVQSQFAKYLKAPNACSKIRWNQKTIINSNYARIHFSDLVTDNKLIYQVVSSLWRYGLAFIEGVPPDHTMTEMVTRRMFPLMKTFYGEVYTICDKADYEDIGFTKDQVDLHTDHTYFYDPAGLQTLHCIQHDGTGGENYVIDGLQVVHQLKETNPRAYDILTRVLVPEGYVDESQHHNHCAPVISLNPVTGEVVQIRWNTYDRDIFNTIPQEDMKEFYDSYKFMWRLIESPENRWTFKLNPGTVIMFDNWRLIHARHAYTGRRVMIGSYVQRADFLSKARLLGVTK